jgi:hypothetical protein
MNEMNRSIQALALSVCCATPLAAQDLCVGFGPQTTRDISSAAGTNTNLFALAPASTEMNVCNIHTHTNAEH